jgi:glycosyltransferase involved in cell wall biosynthesis
MKILCVCSATKSKIAPFIEEQMDSVANMGHHISYFKITKKGLIGYFLSVFSLYRKVLIEKPDILHSHYGLSGFISIFIFWKKKILTVHGSDVHIKKIRLFTKIAYKLTNITIFVSPQLAKLISKNPEIVIPCGINLNLFKPLKKETARNKLNLNKNDNYILFTSSFDIAVKNYDLAKLSIELSVYNIKLIELKNYSRNEVVLLLNAVDLLLMTSHNEGSPQIIKEAMACNTPIVSVDVGTVREIVGNTKNTFICDYNTANISKKIDLILSTKERSFGRDRIRDYDLNIIAKQIIDIYSKVLNKYD